LRVVACPNGWSGYLAATTSALPTVVAKPGDNGVRVNRTDRLYAIAEVLRATAPRARTARDLAERFEVSARTIERDISALQQSGVPIWATPGPGGGYSVDPEMSLPPLNLTADEATAIAVALAASGPIPFADAARAALRKLVAAMSTASREGARELVGRIHLLQQRGQLEATPVVRAVETAVTQRRVLELDYVDASGNRTDHRLVEPYGLAGGQDHWYLMAWCRMRDGGRSFRLDRIQGARVTDEAAPVRQLHEVAGDIAAFARETSLDD
jgi:predicted DNA-binding transcriptional regulator YafY